MPLSRSAGEWAEAVLSESRKSPPPVPSEALARVEKSPFNIDTQVRILERIYAGEN
jgi:hypothetical protein